MAATTAFDREAALAPIAARGGERFMDHTFLQAISLEKPAKKRALELDVLLDGDLELDVDWAVDDAESVTSGDSSSDARGSSPPPAPERRVKAPSAKKQRKPTHVVRKEAKEKLLEEIRHLEARAALLRQETGKADPRELEQSFAINADLREAILQQDLVIANSQSAFTGFMNARLGSPLSLYIHLTKDWNQRRETLLAMKDRKIRDANRFLVERTRHLNPFKASSELSQFETEEGDFCSIKIDVTPFEGVRSVKQVFEAMQFYLMNLEISHSEISGNVTIRENDHDTEKAVLHHRLVIAERAGVVVEKNAVIFMDQSDFESEKPEDQWVIATGDSIDQDDLYPYCSSQRLRKDSTSAFKLTAYRRSRRTTAPISSAASGNIDGSDEGELVVVLTRWHLLRMRRPEFELPKGLFQAIAIDQVTGTDVMLRSMRQGIFSSIGQVNLG